MFLHLADSVRPPFLISSPYPRGSPHDLGFESHPMLLASQFGPNRIWFESRGCLRTTRTSQNHPNLLGDSCHMHLFSINSHQSLQTGGFLSHGGTPFRFSLHLIDGFSINQTQLLGTPHGYGKRPVISKTRPGAPTRPGELSLAGDLPPTRWPRGSSPTLLSAWVWKAKEAWGARVAHDLWVWLVISRCYNTSRVKIVCYLYQIGYVVRKQQRVQESTGNREIFARPTWI